MRRRRDAHGRDRVIVAMSHCGQNDELRICSRRLDIRHDGNCAWAEHQWSERVSATEINRRTRPRRNPLVDRQNQDARSAPEPRAKVYRIERPSEALARVLLELRNRPAIGAGCAGSTRAASCEPHDADHVKDADRSGRRGRRRGSRRLPPMGQELVDAVRRMLLHAREHVGQVRDRVDAVLLA